MQTDLAGTPAKYNGRWHYIRAVYDRGEGFASEARLGFILEIDGKLVTAFQHQIEIEPQPVAPKAQELVE